MNKVRLSELVEFNPKRPLKKGSLAPFIEMAALPESSRDVTNIYEREYKGGGAKFTNGDTLFARITPCLENGKTAKVTGLKCGDVGHGSTEFIVMSPRNPAADEDYVYYLARLPDFRAYAQARMEGTSGRQRVSWQSLADFELQIPDAASRKRAGDTLKTLDDKIQLNHQINQTLEQMAQAIFKSWFVDFEPVKAKIAALEAGGSEEDALLAAMQAISGKSANELARLQTENREQYAELRSTAELFPSAMQESELGEIPEGWAAGTLSDIASFSSSRIPVKELTLETYISTENMLEGKKGICAAASLPSASTVPSFESGEILVSNIRPYFKKIWFASFNGGRSPDVLGFKCRYPDASEYLFNFLYKDKFFEYMMLTSKGAKMPRGDKQAIMQYPLALPPVELMRMFSERVRAFYLLGSSHAQQSKTLASLRDTLLPKLLSGELSVAAAEEKLAEAAET